MNDGLQDHHVPRSDIGRRHIASKTITAPATARNGMAPRFTPLQSTCSRSSMEHLHEGAITREHAPFTAEIQFWAYAGLAIRGRPSLKSASTRTRALRTVRARSLRFPARLSLMRPLKSTFFSNSRVGRCRCRSSFSPQGNNNFEHPPRRKPRLARSNSILVAEG